MRLTVDSWGNLANVDIAGDEVDPVANLGQPGQEAYLTYSKAGGSKAFAVGPDGSWGWASEEAGETEARQEAIANCEQHGDGCYIYSMDGKRLLN